MKRTIKGRKMKRTIKRSFTCHHNSQDIITDILSRLSVKVLIRFKCVCKRWHDLIESFEFVNLHYDKMSTKRKSLLLSSSFWPAVSTFSSDNLEVSRYVDFPFICRYGPCNGVWCLYYLESNIALWNGYNIALWNPATRELKALPKFCARYSYLEDVSDDFWFSVNVGFGYDKNTNDYKVVKISEFNSFISEGISGERYTWVEVYSLSNDCWREIEVTVPISITNAQNSSSASLKETHYWLSDNAILSFNISDEVFETIALPDEVFEIIEVPTPQGNLVTIRTQKEFEELLVLHDSLALVRTYRNYDERRFEVWKLKNNGGAKWWTKVSTIRPPSDFMAEGFRGFFEDGNVVLKHLDGRWMLYDLETHGTKFIRNCADYAGFMIYFYVESLVSFRGGGRRTTPSSFRKLACYDDIFSLCHDEIFHRKPLL